MNIKIKNKINIIPVDNIDNSVLDFIQNSLKRIFKTKIYILDRIDIPENSFVKNRKQHNAAIISNYITEKLSLKYIQDINLAILNTDIFVPSLNFVFGIATDFPKICLISILRLNPLFYTFFSLNHKGQDLIEELTDKERKVFKDRILKEAVHEIGHTLGLNHCNSYKCVMYFSDTLIDTDKKSYNFCSSCLNLLLKE